MINGKSSLRYNDVSTTLVNHEVRRKDKASSSSSITTEVLSARGMSFIHQKDKGDIDKSMIGNCESEKSQCNFYKEE